MDMSLDEYIAKMNMGNKRFVKFNNRKLRRGRTNMGGFKKEMAVKTEIRKKSNSTVEYTNLREELAERNKTTIDGSNSFQLMQHGLNAPNNPPGTSSSVDLDSSPPNSQRRCHFKNNGNNDEEHGIAGIQSGRVERNRGTNAAIKTMRTKIDMTMEDLASRPVEQTLITVHKPKYNLKLQEAIHLYQKKPMFYDPQSGIVASFDGEGIDVIIKPDHTEMSCNRRFSKFEH